VNFSHAKRLVWTRAPSDRNTCELQPLRVFLGCPDESTARRPFPQIEEELIMISKAAKQRVIPVAALPSTDVIPCTSLEGLKHCKNGTFSSTVASMSRLRRRRDRFEALARSLRDVLSQRRLLPRRRMRRRTPDDYTTFRWNFSSVARSRTTL
jgi:hypothetical protein